MSLPSRYAVLAALLGGKEPTAKHTPSPLRYYLGNAPKLSAKPV